jgi:glycosyltransferase involved in cell wall biosynthesis
LSDRVIAISVVVPVLNEQGNIAELAARLVQVLMTLCQREGLADDAFEIIFVDDGSADGSWSMLRSAERVSSS